MGIYRYVILITTLACTAWILLVASGYHPDEGSDRAETSAKENSPNQKKEEKNILELSWTGTKEHYMLA